MTFQTQVLKYKKECFLILNFSKECFQVRIPNIIFLNSPIKMFKKKVWTRMGLIPINNNKDINNQIKNKKVYMRKKWKKKK